MLTNEDPFSCKEPTAEARKQTQEIEEALRQAKNTERIIQCFMETKAFPPSELTNKIRGKIDVFATDIGKLKEDDDWLKELCKLDSNALSFVIAAYNRRVTWSNLLASQINGFLKTHNVPSMGLDITEHLKTRKRKFRTLLILLEAVSRNSNTDSYESIPNSHTGRMTNASGYNEIDSRGSKRQRLDEPSQQPANPKSSGTYSMTFVRYDALTLLFTQQGLDIFPATWTWDHYNSSMNLRAYLYSNTVHFIMDAKIVSEEDVNANEVNFFRSDTWQHTTIKQQQIRRYIMVTPRKKGEEICNMIFNFC